jgi:hypothetical protein
LFLRQGLAATFTWAVSASQVPGISGLCYHSLNEF